MPPPVSSTARRRLVWDILEQVSRSFYLTLAVLPQPIRDQVGLAYLFARAGDTIADTDLIDRPVRLGLLKEFRAQFVARDVNWAAVGAIQSAAAPHQASAGERALLNRLAECFRVYATFETEDRERIAGLMMTLLNGMEMDLTVFPGDTAQVLTALETPDDLDRYTYYVAGCVGEFWTKMTCAHLPSLRDWNVTEMAKVGVRFGKGLQLTNVLKDLPRDLRRGRCYIPRTLLKEVGLEPQDLLTTGSIAALHPIISRLIELAVGHLDQGWLYTMAVPRHEIRLRLACMWPILFAGETLRRVDHPHNVLDPANDHKISRAQVYGIIGLTTVTGGCGYVGTAYWGRLRKMLEA